MITILSSFLTGDIKVEIKCNKLGIKVKQAFKTRVQTESRFIMSQLWLTDQYSVNLNVTTRSKPDRTRLVLFWYLFVPLFSL